MSDTDIHLAVCIIVLTTINVSPQPFTIIHSLNVPCLLRVSKQPEKHEISVIETHLQVDKKKKNTTYGVITGVFSPTCTTIELMIEFELDYNIQAQIR